MSFDFLQAVTTGGTVAGAIQGLKYLETFLAKRNGNGNGNKFSQDDHDRLRDISRGVDLLHEDMLELSRDLRDCVKSAKT